MIFVSVGFPLEKGAGRRPVQGQGGGGAKKDSGRPSPKFWLLFSRLRLTVSPPPSSLPLKESFPTRAACDTRRIRVCGAFAVSFAFLRRRLYRLLRLVSPRFFFRFGHRRVFILSQVFGMSWREEDYTVYAHWNNTPDQLAEMSTFNVTGFQQCISGSHSSALVGGV